MSSYSENSISEQLTCELVSGRPCTVKNHKFAESSKFLQCFLSNKMVFANENLFQWKTPNCSSIW